MTEQPGPFEFAGPRSLGPWIVLAAGIVFTLALQTTIRDEVFFSGDGGLKALMVRQWASGERRFDLRLPADDWVRQIWDRGYYPFAAPFAYPAHEGDFRWPVPGTEANSFYLAFPPWFSVISTPFYRLLGFRGLYVLPLVSTWLIWLRFITLNRWLGISATSLSLGLAALIFASPLTLYSAMFWEHAPAAALSFWGVTEAIRPTDPRRPRCRPALGGVMLGLAGWLRPECFVVAAAVLLALWLNVRLGPDRRGAWLAMCWGSVVTAGLFVLANLSVYGTPWGVHPREALSLFGGGGFLNRAWANGRSLNADAIIFSPALLYVPVHGALAVRGRGWSPAVRLLLICIVLSALAIPMIVPNTGGTQWGPRFMLAVAPLGCFCAALMLGELEGTASRGLLWSARAAFGILLVAGAALNSGLGVRVLARDYRERVLPALVELRASEDKLVVVSHQFVAQELEAAMPDHTFLRCETDSDMEALAPMLQDLGHERFIFILAVYDPDPVPRELVWKSNGATTMAKLRGRYGEHYFIYDAKVAKSP